MIEFGTIEQEAAACREAWRGSKVGDLAWHCHHEKLWEPLSEPAENRIAYILSAKPEKEQALRLRLFRPVKSAAVATELKAYDAAVVPEQKAYDAAVASARKAYDAAVATAWKAYDAAVAPEHAEECHGCPWNGRTIFP